MSVVLAVLLRPDWRADVHQAGGLDRSRRQRARCASPSSSSRKPPAIAEDGELIVYYFGGTGGTVEANLQRWTTQFQSTAAPVRTTATVNGLQLTNLDVSGTYVAEVRPGATERHNKPGFRMRASVVETPKGPYFIKLTGPAATIDGAGAAFEQFLKSLAFKPLKT